MRKFLLAALALMAMMSLCCEAQADNPYRIRMAYERINLNAYRRMMFQRYPTAFGKRFWGFVDNHLLQTDGPADQALRLLLNRLEEELDTASVQTAQRAAVPDSDLTAANSRMDAVLTKLGIEIPPQGNKPGPTENLSTPAQVPPGVNFEGPSGGAPRWPWPL